MSGECIDVTTPFFISQDLYDPVVWNWLNDWQLMSNEYELAQIVHDDLLDFGAAGIEPRPIPPGIFGLHCGAHEFTRSQMGVRNAHIRWFDPALLAPSIAWLKTPLHDIAVQVGSTENHCERP